MSPILNLQNGLAIKTTQHLIHQAMTRQKSFDKSVKSPSVDHGPERRS